MRITSRKTAIAFFITLGVCLAATAAVLSTSWIILNWREMVPLILGVIFFGFIIAGVILNTIFLVREIRRNEQQDSFLNAMTHELKTPITSIRLYLETLQKRDVDEHQRREFYQVMLEDTQRLMGTVEGSAAGGARSAEKRACFLWPRSRSVRWCRTRWIWRAPGITFPSRRWTGRRTAGPPLTLSVMGDREELSTALSNVLDNAVKYSPKDPRIRVEVVTPDLRSVQIRVHDNGVGIPRGELKRVFKRFYRVLTPGSNSGEGKRPGLVYRACRLPAATAARLCRERRSRPRHRGYIQLPRNSQ